MKIIHNITFLIDASIHVQWYNWMVENIFPDYKESDVIFAYKLSKIISTQPSKGLTFALQLEFDSSENWEQYANFVEPVLLRDLKFRYQDSALTFATTMEIIEQG